MGKLIHNRELTRCHSLPLYMSTPCLRQRGEAEDPAVSKHVLHMTAKYTWASDMTWEDVESIRLRCTDFVCYTFLIARPKETISSLHPKYCL
jgi:hypothetical protein